MNRVSTVGTLLLLPLLGWANSADSCLDCKDNDPGCVTNDAHLDFQGPNRLWVSPSGGGDYCHMVGELCDDPLCEPAQDAERLVLLISKAVRAGDIRDLKHLTANDPSVVYNSERGALQVYAGCDEPGLYAHLPLSDGDAMALTDALPGLSQRRAPVRGATPRVAQ